MAFTTVCPNCDSRLTAPDTVLGKKVKCKKCDEPFVAKRAAGPGDDENDRPARPSQAAAPKARSRPAREDDDEDEAPPRKPARSRRPADDEADEDRPRRRRRDDAEDDEPRPKAKKKGKKKQGSPVLLFVLVGIGALLLIGGGVGAYVFFSEPKAPTTAAAGGLGDGSAGAGGQNRDLLAGWTETHEAVGRYRLKFPSAPERNTEKAPPEVGGELVFYQARSPNGLFLSFHRPLGAADRQGVSDDAIASQTLDLLIKLQVPGAQIGDSKAITYQSFKGREAAVTPPGTRFVFTCRVIVAGERVIALGGQELSAPANPPRVTAFFESLKIE